MFKAQFAKANNPWYRMLLLARTILTTDRPDHSLEFEKQLAIVVVTECSYSYTMFLTSTLAEALTAAESTSTAVDSEIEG